MRTPLGAWAGSGGRTKLRAPGHEWRVLRLNTCVMHHLSAPRRRGVAHTTNYFTCGCARSTFNVEAHFTRHTVTYKGGKAQSLTSDERAADFSTTQAGFLQCGHEMSTSGALVIRMRNVTNAIPSSCVASPAVATCAQYDGYRQ